MLKFLAVVISLFFVRAVVAIPAEVEVRGVETYPIHTPTSLINVDVDALVKLAKLDLLKVDLDIDILKKLGFWKRGLLPPPHPDYPWSAPPLLDIDLDLIVKLAKAKLVIVDLGLDIFKGHLKREESRGLPPPSPPLLDIDLALIIALAKQKLFALGFIDIGILGKRGGEPFPWYYPLIDIDVLLIVKLIEGKLLDVPLDVVLLLKGLLGKRGGAWPGYPKPLVLIDLDLIVKLIATKLI